MSKDNDPLKNFEDQWQRLE